MNKKELLTHWNEAITNGTFLTNKHDPTSVGKPYPGYRTVTVKSQPEIQDFLASGDYSVRHYRNTNFPQSPDYIEIVPTDASMVAGSGIQPNSPVPTTGCDRFVAVSGVQQGWHLYAEQSANIQGKQSSGILTYLADLL